jgi:uncharacterized surface protein with fasciclin (FAS1) repeats
MKKILGLFVLSFMLAFGLAFAQSGGASSGGSGGNASGGNAGGQSNTIADLLAGNSQFSTLVKALKSTGLYLTLQEGGPYTLFAPTNDAFDALPSGQLTALMDHPKELTALLKYHVAVGQHLTAPLTLTTLEGSTLNITQSSMGMMSGGMAMSGGGMSGGAMSGGMGMSGGSRAGFMINGAILTGPIITASNGLIYPIDEVLMPPDLNLKGLGSAGAMSGGSGGQ